MTENERNGTDSKQRIRDRYKGVDTSELEIIPARPPESAVSGKMKRVAPYIRVSTDNDEQTSSYELQKNYFEEYVTAQPNWILVGIYADEGISGTSINHREGLQRLLDDCRAGKIDYIITKSISRFARNIVDCLNMIEELRDLHPPVGVIFETDHIDTLASNDSLLLSILASLAEAESRNKSEIMNWSIENRFSRGIFLLPELLGFDKDEDGNLIINEDEADTIRLCFDLFVAGFSVRDIAELLTDLDRKTGYNKQRNKKHGVVPEYKTTWSNNGVVEILRNERHCGDVLARKTYTPNFKTHKSVKNRGQRAQVRKRDHHQAIVSRAVWEAANKKLDLMYGQQNKPFPTLKVVDNGALCGFVPVNRNWGGFSSNDFKIACESVYKEPELKEPDETSILSDYNVVRSQLFNTAMYPSMTISRGKLKFNTACLRRFENVEYVEMLFNYVEKCIAIRPCEMTNPNAIHWGSLKDGKWTVLEKSCRGFAGPLFDTMAWDSEVRYRLRGSYLSSGDTPMMLFDLDEPEMIHRVVIEEIPEEPEQIDEIVLEETGAIDQPKKNVYKQVIQFPEQWYSSFGKSYDEEALYLERIHYAGDWDVLRPAREVFGINQITDEEIDMLFYEAEKIIDKLRVSI